MSNIHKPKRGWWEYVKTGMDSPFSPGSAAEKLHFAMGVSSRASYLNEIKNARENLDKSWVDVPTNTEMVASAETTTSNEGTIHGR